MRPLTLHLQRREQCPGPDNTGEELANELATARRQAVQIILAKNW
jgi:hypothetical protein